MRSGKLARLPLLDKARVPGRAGHIRIIDLASLGKHHMQLRGRAHQQQRQRFQRRLIISAEARVGQMASTSRSVLLRGC